MIDRDFIAALSCPYCRSGLEIRWSQTDPRGGVQHGIVGCACYEYPVVDGILVLRQLSGPADTRDQGVELLRSGDADASRAYLQSAASMVPKVNVDRSNFSSANLKAIAQKARQLVRRRPASADGRGSPITDVAPVRIALEDQRPGAFASYLYQRYANPSFVAAIPMMALLEAVEQPPSGRSRAAVLDLACGIGHSTAMMQTLFPNADYVATDPDFVNLQILQRHFVKEAICVCVDAELPLPFADDQFDAVFCLDAFHYIRAKWALARELDRIVDEGGVWIFPHLHNAGVENVSPGIPMRPSDYVRMLDFAGGSLLDESVVLEQFMVEHLVDLANSPPASALRAAPNLSMYGCRRPDVRRKYQIGRRWVDTRRTASLGVNPIYAIENEAASIRLRMTWPDAELERECADIMRYMPNEVVIEASLLDRFLAEACSEEDELEIAELVSSLVLVPLPPGYHRLASPPGWRGVIPKS